MIAHVIAVLGVRYGSSALPIKYRPVSRESRRCHRVKGMDPWYASLCSTQLLYGSTAEHTLTCVDWQLLMELFNAQRVIKGETSQSIYLCSTRTNLSPLYRSLR
jgi:hypothetical protein